MSFRPRRGVAIVALAAALAVHAPGAAQQGSLRDGVELSKLRFIGMSDENFDINSRLTLDDAALLAATAEARTLNYLINGRLPVRASRLQELIAWGLMRQEGTGFRSLVPVLRGERAERFEQLIVDVAPTVAAETQLAMDRISERVWRHPGVATLPAITAWLLRDRVWAHLSGANGLDLDRRLVEQQMTYPDRGFWGVLWYVDDPEPPAFDFHQWRRERYTIQIAWNHGEGDPLFGATDGPVPLPEILAKLDDGGRRLDDREDFPGALAAGLVDADGNMRVLAREYRLNDAESLAYYIEEAAVAITESLMRHVPARNLGQLLDLQPEMAAVIAYTEIAPRLVAEYERRDLLVRAGDPRAEWRTTFETEEQEPGPPRRATVVGEDIGQAGIPEVIPPYSAIIWRDLPVRPTIRIAWW